MLKSTIRLAPRRIVSSKLQSTTRFLSTAPPVKKSRSWKSGAARWAIAIGGIYWYNTSPLFAEEPEASIAKLDESIHHIQESPLPTLDAIVEEKRQRKLAAEREEQTAKEAYLAARNAESDEAKEARSEAEGLGELEEEAGQQAAFNPETGEINWDCPCLGGMAHGPCGEEFKAAFSCFVYSKEEPKGMECIDKFKGMQNCFRAHPEVYGAELEDDEEEVEEELRAREELKARESVESKESDKETQKAEPEAKSPPVTQPKTPSNESSNPSTPAPTPTPAPSKSPDHKPEIALSNIEKERNNPSNEGGQLVPKAAFDATDKN